MYQICGRKLVHLTTARALEVSTRRPMNASTRRRMRASMYTGEMTRPDIKKNSPKYCKNSFIKDPSTAPAFHKRDKRAKNNSRGMAEVAIEEYRQIQASVRDGNAKAHPVQ